MTFGVIGAIATIWNRPLAYDGKLGDWVPPSSTGETGSNRLELVSNVDGQAHTSTGHNNILARYANKSDEADTCIESQAFPPW